MIEWNTQILSQSIMTAVEMLDLTHLIFDVAAPLLSRAPL